MRSAFSWDMKAVYTPWGSTTKYRYVVRDRSFPFPYWSYSSHPPPFAKSQPLDIGDEFVFFIDGLNVLVPESGGATAVCVGDGVREYRGGSGRQIVVGAAEQNRSLIDSEGHAWRALIIGLLYEGQLSWRVTLFT